MLQHPRGTSTAGGQQSADRYLQQTQEGAGSHPASTRLGSLSFHGVCWRRHLLACFCHPAPKPFQEGPARTPLAPMPSSDCLAVVATPAGGTLGACSSLAGSVLCDAVADTSCFQALLPLAEPELRSGGETHQYGTASPALGVCVCVLLPFWERAVASLSLWAPPFHPCSPPCSQRPLGLGNLTPQSLQRFTLQKSSSADLRGPWSLATLSLALSAVVVAFRAWIVPPWHEPWVLWEPPGPPSASGHAKGPPGTAAMTARPLCSPGLQAGVPQSRADKALMPGQRQPAAPPDGMQIQEDVGKVRNTQFLSHSRLPWMADMPPTAAAERHRAGGRSQKPQEASQKGTHSGTSPRSPPAHRRAQVTGAPGSQAQHTRRETGRDWMAPPGRRRLRGAPPLAIHICSSSGELLGCTWRTE